MNFSKPILGLALSIGIIMILAYFILSPESCDGDIFCNALFLELQKVIIFLGILLIGFMIFISALIDNNLENNRKPQKFTGMSRE